MIQLFILKRKEKGKFIEFIPLRYCVFNQIRYLTEHYRSFFVSGLNTIKPNKIDWRIQTKLQIRVSCNPSSKPFTKFLLTIRNEMKSVFLFDSLSTETMLYKYATFNSNWHFEPQKKSNYRKRGATNNVYILIQPYLWPTYGCIKDPDLGISELVLADLWVTGRMEGWSAAAIRLLVAGKGEEWCSQLW